MLMHMPGEKEAIAVVLAYGDLYGFGNLISHMQEAWSQRLQNQGIPKHAADMGAWKIKAFSDENDSLRSELESARAVISVAKGMWRDCPNANPDPCGRCDLCQLERALAEYDKVRGRG